MNWSRKYEKCIGCGTTETKHHSSGLCYTCYNRKRYEDPEYREKHKKCCYSWNERNREKKREIDLRACKKYQAKNRDKINAHTRERYANEPGYRERRLKATRKYYVKTRGDEPRRTRQNN